MRIFGLISELDKYNRIITLKTARRVYYLYLKRGQMSQFKYYLFPGNYLDLEIISPIKKGKFEAYQVDYFWRILSVNPRKIFFDRLKLEDSLGTFLEQPKYKLFLDLEKTMPPYLHKGYFVSEIIQIAYILLDKDDNEVLRYSSYVKPKSQVDINDRTCKFLDIRKKDFYKVAISPQKAYNIFKKIIKKYNPAIVVYGRNDILSLSDFYRLNRLPTLKYNTRFINLSSLISEYYHHSKEYGLFKLYEAYYHENMLQTHDAFIDAVVTAYVFNGFKKDVKNKVKSLDIKG